jgi:hypothetical protein
LFTPNVAGLIPAAANFLLISACNSGVALQSVFTFCSTPLLRRIHLVGFQPEIAADVIRLGERNFDECVVAASHHPSSSTAASLRAWSGANEENS